MANEPKPKRQKDNLILLGVRVEPKHKQALQDEALRRQREQGGGRMDVSEVVRDLVTAWMKSRR